MRDDRRSHVIDYLGRQDGILVIAETGFLKMGLHSAGVQRQYSSDCSGIPQATLAAGMANATGDVHYSSIILAPMTSVHRYALPVSPTREE
ncbi:hypothetical protein [Noviherbaspirillum aerium]|uniref:hypothetical protein n=1 Tax=Noviherbaspirillum aerium TaxID=2588497 RepID=UPI00178C4672